MKIARLCVVGALLLLMEIDNYSSGWRLLLWVGILGFYWLEKLSWKSLPESHVSACCGNIVLQNVIFKTWVLGALYYPSGLSFYYWANKCCGWGMRSKRGWHLRNVGVGGSSPCRQPWEMVVGAPGKSWFYTFSLWCNCEENGLHSSKG